MGMKCKQLNFLSLLKWRHVSNPLHRCPHLSIIGVLIQAESARDTSGAEVSNQVSAFAGIRIPDLSIKNSVYANHYHNEHRILVIS